MKSKPLQRAYEVAEEIDQFVAKNGLLPLIKNSLSRFDFNVQVQHDDGTSFAYNSAYAVVWENWLMIFPEHHDTNVMALNELHSWTMTRKLDSMPRVEMKFGAVRLVREDDNEKE